MILITYLDKEKAYNGMSLVGVVRGQGTYYMRFPEKLTPWHLAVSGGDSENLAYLHPLRYATPRQGKRLKQPTDIHVSRFTKLEEELPCQICTRLALFDCRISSTNFIL